MKKDNSPFSRYRPISYAHLTLYGRRVSIKIIHGSRKRIRTEIIDIQSLIPPKKFRKNHGTIISRCMYLSDGMCVQKR